MQGPADRSVVIISGLLTLLVLGSATLAIAFRNGWVHVAADAPSRNAVTALVQRMDAESSRPLPTAREADSLTAFDAGAAQSEVLVYREKLEEAYRALDDAYAQIQSLHTTPSRRASRGDGDRAFTEHDADDRRERGSRRRESDDD